MTVAKSLGGGLVPIGAMLARPDVWGRAYGTVQTCMLHTSTFSGGSLACAAGLAAVRTVVQEDLAERSRVLGERLIEGLRSLMGRVRCLRDVRGQGLMIGIEFNEWPKTAITHWKSLDETGMTQFLVGGYDEMVAALHPLQAMYILQNRFGIYVQSTRSNPQVIRLQPPLTISDTEVDRVLDALETTCREVDHICGALTGGVSKSSLGKHDASSNESTDSESVPGGAKSLG